VTVNVVAIDGPVGSGKSTVARALATSLDWAYLDTGAMYRAVTAAALRRGIDLQDARALAELASRLDMAGWPSISIDGEELDAFLRDPATNAAVSLVSAIPAVRRALVPLQRAFAADHNGVVVEGRDTTTVVFPDARLKVFLTATVEERTRRRDDEHPESIRRRDAVDSTRSDSPLQVADQAVVIDTTVLSVADVVKEISLCLTAAS
jgi:cytidylate kinase